MYFVSGNEVYAFNGSSAPQPLCGDAIKDDVYSSAISSAVVAVDTDNRELWVAAKQYFIYVWSMDYKRWIGYYQLTDSSASETPFTPYGAIMGMVYMKPAGESSREMWLSFTTATSTTTIAKLRSSQTQDNLDGTSREVVKEYVFHGLETPRPRQQMTVQRIGIDHRMTASQSGSTLRYAVSLDNGSTFCKYNDVRLTALSGADTETGVIRVPVHQTTPRMVLKLQHTGLTGVTYFNLTGGEAEVILRGREIQAANATAVSSSL